MGKTYRRNSDFQKASDRRQRRKLERAPETIGVPDFVKRMDEAKQITPEWVVERLARHIDYEVDRLISKGWLQPSDKEFYVSYLSNAACKAIPSYNPIKDAAESPCHYFTVVVDNTLTHVRNYLLADKRRRKMIPIYNVSPEEAEKRGCVSEEELSDNCRNIRDLEFRMDVNTLRSMLTAEERKVLSMRLEGYTNAEIGEAIGSNRHRVEKTVLKHIQEVARLCGFVPQREIRVMERMKKVA